VKVFSYRGQFQRFLELPGQGGSQPVVSALGVDPEGNVYVGDDAAGQVVVFDPGLRYRFRFASRGEEAGQLKSIAGIAVQGRIIAVIDHQAVAVQLFDRAGNHLRGWGAHEMGAENFSLPAGVAIDAKGRIVVVDALRHEIKLFQQDGKFIGRYGGLGTGPGNVVYPSDVAVDRRGRLVVSESVGNRVQILREVEPGEQPVPAASSSKGGGRERPGSIGLVGPR
jgi:tripartite motif-containing protein 71